MKKKATWSQIVCWIAAGLDAITAALLTWPRYGMWAYGADAEALTPLVQSLSGMAAALMWGWTALLLVASFRRSMRREVLILTIVPVMAGLLYNSFLDADPRMLRVGLGMWGMMVFQGLVVVLLITGVIAHWREGVAAKQPPADLPDLSTVVLTPPADTPPVAQEPAAPAQHGPAPNVTAQPAPNVAPLEPEAQSRPVVPPEESHPADV